MVRIVTDSSSDISPSLAAELGVTVVPIRIKLGSGVYLDGVDIDHNEFYRQLSRGPVLPQVEPPLVEEFQAAYDSLLKGTEPILAIQMSSQLSGVAQVARDAAKAFVGRGKVTAIDSRMVSWGLKILVGLAAEAAQRGTSVDETVRLIRGVIPHIYMVFFTDTLEYWERHRRRARSRTHAEPVQGLKPLLIVEDGEIVPMERVRSRGKPVDRLFEFVTEFAYFERATVLRGRFTDDAQALYQRLTDVFPKQKLDIEPYGPALATYLGPGALGVGVYEGF
jgi:DegV family protein with EDD domain